MDATLPVFLDLPDDVLFHIFSYLPLNMVFLLERLCHRFRQAVSLYLTTLKELNLYNSEVVQDLFRVWNPRVSVSAGVLTKLLQRCPLTESIAYIPAGPQASDELCEEWVRVVAAIGKAGIKAIGFVNDKKFFDEIQNQNLDILVQEAYLSSARAIRGLPTHSSLTRFSTFDATNVIHLEDVKVDSSLLVYCSVYRELSFVRCSFEIQTNFDLSHLTLPNLCKFLYIEQPGRSASRQLGALIVQKAGESEKLRTLCLGLSDFSALETASSSWKATNLEILEVVSTGSYSASLQQLKYASIVADICKLCRSNIQRITLPSSILIKRFFSQLISSGLHFNQLQALQMTGVADTKMFLSPGNLVETLFYQEFLKICPVISSLSLHSYTGSLVSLVLPLSLTELVLPWDNRLNLQKQKEEILACLATVPQLKSLSILGVEEVDALLLEHGSIHRGHLPSIVISIEPLEVFRLKNVCIRSLDLTGCVNLDVFSIQCCPTMRDLLVPVDSLSSVNIYDSYVSYVERFVSQFLSKRTKGPACHLHLQLHSVVQQEPDAKKEHKRNANHLFSVVEEACKNSKSEVDFFILKDHLMHVFEHNSGELMYPFTEFQVDDKYMSGRSEVEMRAETDRRQCILEGIRRWKKAVVEFRATKPAMGRSSEAVVFSSTLSYCGCAFHCSTNMQYLLELNTSPNFCQPSGKCVTADDKAAPLMGLNVPRLTSSFQMQDLKMHKVIPVIFVSIIEYAHNIYTLFYYD